ncbi:MAG: Hsp20/alpha crystallin family protein, partial [Candidatus Heimdallarchaeota archaeon]
MKTKKEQMNCCGPKMRFHPNHMAKFFDRTGFASNQHYNTHQNVKDDNLVITMLVPGIVKDTIKIRAKPNKMTIHAEKKPEIVDVYGEKEFNIVVSLDEEVVPDSAKARYID